MSLKTKMIAEGAKKKQERELTDADRQAKRNKLEVAKVRQRCDQERRSSFQQMDRLQQEVRKKSEKLEEKRRHSMEESEARQASGIIKHRAAEAGKSVALLLAQDYTPLPAVEDMIAEKKLKEDVIPPILKMYLELEEFDNRDLCGPVKTESFDHQHLPQIIKHCRQPSLAQHILQVHKEIYKFIEQLGTKFTELELKEIARLIEKMEDEGSELNVELVKLFGSSIAQHPTMQKKKVALSILLKKMTSDRKGQGFDPGEALRTQYLRLSNKTVEDLTELCVRSGKSIELHTHISNLSTDETIDLVFGKDQPCQGRRFTIAACTTNDRTENSGVSGLMDPTTAATRPRRHSEFNTPPHQIKNPGCSNKSHNNKDGYDHLPSSPSYKSTQTN